MKRLARGLIVCIGLLGAVANVAQAQQLVSISPDASLLRASTSVRALGMAGAATAGALDPTFFSINPASIGGRNHLAVGASQVDQNSTDVRNGLISTAFSFMKGDKRVRLGVAISITQKKSSGTYTFIPAGGSSEVTEAFDRDDNMSALGLGGALEGDRYRGAFGVALKWLRVRDEGGAEYINTDVYTPDIGGNLWRAYEAAPLQTVVAGVGISFLNLTDSDVYEAPKTGRYGGWVRWEKRRDEPLPEWLGEDVPVLSAKLGLDIIDPMGTDESAAFGVGLEASYMELFHVRAGWRDASPESRETVGLGFGPMTDSLIIRLDGAWSKDDAGAAGFVAGFAF